MWTSQKEKVEDERKRALKRAVENLLAANTEMRAQNEHLRAVAADWEMRVKQECRGCKQHPLDPCGLCSWSIYREHLKVAGYLKETSDDE